ncbi:hypothetical protein P280DRAFT_159176 [Massarina eburnea CBS 473.64]|uniref:BAH domain-containing protein n=1 Tax=Massarina eburnea CBS 473.64 TaxID=1395130 RepID=A0A6A6RLE5_9PLEO|nr:hypothetical protein P280DRAFT_159176 [Massarina eburnea CBS 473.64]
MARLKKLPHIPSDAPSDEGASAPAETDRIDARAQSSAGKKRKRPLDVKALVQKPTFTGFSVKPVGKKKRRKLELEANHTGEIIFKGTQITDQAFETTHSDHWGQIRRYRTFTLFNGAEHFSVGDDIYVNPSDADPLENRSTEDACVKDWVARIVEIRGVDADHVYVRVFWLYRPEDLPGGRQSYHGFNELIASNHMDIIEATTVHDRAIVAHRTEDAENAETFDPMQLFWRQTYDVTKPAGKQLSKLKTHCTCERYHNPDDLLVQCDACQLWLHGPCLEEAVLGEALKEALEKAPAKNASDSKAKHKKNSKQQNDGDVPVTATLSHAEDGKMHLSITYNNSKSEEVPIKCLHCAATISEYEDEPVANGETSSPAIQVIDDNPSTASKKG